MSEEEGKWKPQQTLILKNLKIKKDEVINVPYIMNPITKKMSRRDTPAIQKLIDSQIISEDGTILLSQEEFNQMLASHKAKMLIKQNRVLDAILAHLVNMPIHEVYTAMKACETEIKTGNRDEEIKNFEKQQSSLKTDIEAIKAMRKK